MRKRKRKFLLLKWKKKQLKHNNKKQIIWRIFGYDRILLYGIFLAVLLLFHCSVSFIRSCLQSVGRRRRPRLSNEKKKEARNFPHFPFFSALFFQQNGNVVCCRGNDGLSIQFRRPSYGMNIFHIFSSLSLSLLSCLVAAVCVCISPHSTFPPNPATPF